MKKYSFFIAQAHIVLGNYDVLLSLKRGGHSIKCKNNINHQGKKGKLWTSDIIYNGKTPLEIVGELAIFMKLPPQTYDLYVANNRGR